MLIRRAVWPLRDVVNKFQKDETKLIAKSSGMFLRDLYDHAVQVIDTTENYREMVAGLLETYLTSVNNRMNEVMKVLTIISTIFIPLTFITGIYGMNFVHMPELSWKGGYFIALGLMVVIFGGMTVFFRKKNWL